MNVNLLLRIEEILEHHFMQLCHDAVAVTQQTNQIATALGALAQQKQRQYKEAKQEKDDVKAASVEKMLGRDNLHRFLTMVRLPNEGQLKFHCPFYHKLAKSPKAQRLGVLESSAQAAMEDKGHHHLSFPLSAGLLSNLLTLQWRRLGIHICNLYGGDSDEEQQQAVNLQVTMMESGGAAMSSADVSFLIKMAINLPGENYSVNNLRRMEALISILLPTTHPFLTYSEAH